VSGGALSTTIARTSRLTMARTPIIRRAVPVILALGVLAPPLAVEGQSSGKVVRIGMLSMGTAPSVEGPAGSLFLAALRDLGWVAGRNVVFEPRYAAGHTDRLPALAAELVRLKVDVIVTFLNQETLAAKQATSSIPIVMVLGVFPEEAGLVASLAHPGGNVTGTTVAPVAAKYLELLKQAVPKLARVAILWDPTFPGLAQGELEVAARKLGLTLAWIEVQRSDDVAPALARIAKERPGALWIIPVGPLLAHTRQVIDFATKHRLPTIFPARDFVDTGGLMSYGYDREHLMKRAASYVDRVLKGTKPGDLPIEQPTKFELVINLKTAKAIGLTFPQSLLLRADQLIE
jgi:putative tryptophan/tyrosine transport system substrate-binding protein